jgi:YidC/Oxa1 family membrane protein insertase
VNPLNPLYDAVAWVLSRIYGVVSPVFGDSSGWTWALTIALLVVFMRLIMVPLFIKQMHTTRRMTALAPQMTALRKKYKNDKQTLNQEMMKLYQEAGVNPLMGCLPVVAQLPMFFALFSVLRAIAEWKPGDPTKYGMTHAMVESAQQAKILGVTIADKFLTSGTPLHVRIVILLTVVVSMITTYLTIRQSMKRGMMPAATPDNPMGQSQKYMAYIMPFFALSGLYWPFGLVLYWVTTNLWTLGQQYVLFLRYPMPLPANGAAAGGTTAAAPALRGGPDSNGSAGSRPGRGRSGRPAVPPAGGKRQDRSARQPAQGKPGGPESGRPRPEANGRGAGGGVLRRLGKGRPEPEQQPAPPEVKLVRQQRQRQSRSKRSGKR